MCRWFPKCRFTHKIITSHVVISLFVGLFKESIPCEQQVSAVLLQKCYIPFVYFYQYFKLCSLYSCINHHKARNTVINNVHFWYMSANILSEISAHSVGSSLATLSVTVIICVLLCCHHRWWLWCWCVLL